MNITEFQKSRFGLFIHWGIYAIPARGEWVRSNEEMKEEDYIPNDLGVVVKAMQEYYGQE